MLVNGPSLEIACSVESTSSRFAVGGSEEMHPPESVARVVLASMQMKYEAMNRMTTTTFPQVMTGAISRTAEQDTHATPPCHLLHLAPQGTVMGLSSLPRPRSACYGRRRLCTEDHFYNRLEIDRVIAARLGPNSTFAEREVAAAAIEVEVMAEGP